LRPCWLNRWPSKLNQIPKIAVQIFKDGDRSVFFRFGFSHKSYALLLHISIVSPKVVGSQKQKNSSACLITYPASLLFTDTFRE
jgi:hypothetical protein